MALESDLFCACSRYAPAVPCHAPFVARFLDTIPPNPMSLVAAPGLSSRALPPRSKADSQATAATVACVSLCALVLVAPFEALRPLVTVPGQSLTTVEAALVAALGAWALVTLAMRVVPAWRAPLTLPLLALIAATAIAAIAAPEYRGNSFNMVGRAVLGFLIYLMTLNAVTSVRRLAAMMAAIAFSGLVVWPLVLFEYAEAAPVTTFLARFREFSANVGGALRASGPFQYPTIASMYLEIAFCAALATFLANIERRRYSRSIALGIAVAAIGQAIILTSSRAGLGIMLAVLTVVGLIRIRRVGFDPGVQGLFAIAAVLAIQFPTTHSFQTLGLRMATEGQNAWYSASFDVPIEVSLPTKGIISVPIRVTNTGLTVWNSAVNPPFRLSYHLLLEDDRVSSWQGLRTDFPRPINPGESVTMNAAVEAPMKPGRYRIMWDIERVGWLWFSTEPGAPMFVTNANVTGDEVGPVGEPYQAPLPTAPNRPGRLLLWRAALGMFFAHPFTGVGLDNYRLQYGPYAGLANFDNRVHSNNMYLEILAGTGLTGAVAFGWLSTVVASLLVGVLKAVSDPETRAIASGLALAIGAMALHGVVDSFLSFTPTYVLFAVILGLVAASPIMVCRDAYRI